MHFSKTYSRLLSTLPPELRSNAIEYRQLKRLINQTVVELDALGLGLSVLHGADGQDRHATIAYEVAWNANATAPEPRLRLSSATPDGAAAYRVDLPVPEHVLGRISTALARTRPAVQDDSADACAVAPTDMSGSRAPDAVIPLPSDAAFFRLLASTLSSLPDHLATLLDGFHVSLAALAASISSGARPASSSAPGSFSAYSPTADNVVTLRPRQAGKSDLYTWREILRLYAEAQVFDSISGPTHGERSVEDAERQFKLFEQLVLDKKASLVFSQSRDALDVFLSLNVFILDVKKFQLANADATRKILKKHTKRTTLCVPLLLLERGAPSAPLPPAMAPRSTSLPRLLVQAIGEVLLPVVPHIDDYSCLICTYVAFKPIRLGCGHFFCVRCLVKLQRRGTANCPLCRAPTVLQADSSNVDYGLLNLVADWFPIESREKLRVNEKEVTEEQLEALGVANAHGCRIM